MALPTIETPRYELTLPSQDIKVQFRPFLVKEEKILLVDKEKSFLEWSTIFLEFIFLTNFLIFSSFVDK